MENINHTTTLLDLNRFLRSAMHRFRTSESKIPVLLIHGSIEDARIFYSRKGKGLAPFLAARGFDVFAPDLAGKGESLPKIHRGLQHTQNDVINRDIPLFLNHIRKYYPQTPIRLGAHSWGGVMLLAWYARHGNTENTGPCVFFGSKRRIGIFSLRRLFMLDIIWTIAGEAGTRFRGYMPAKALGMGSEDEPAQLYRDVNRWVYSKVWKDPDNGFDFAKTLSEKSQPPTLYFAGVKDYVLGHPLDVERLMRESGNDQAEFVLLSKTNGNLADYGHINMLTGKTCPDDHFALAARWLRNGTLT